MKTTIASAMLQVIGKGFKDMLLRKLGIPPEIPSPHPRIGFTDMVYDQDRKELTIRNIPELSFISVQNTNSMDGLLDVWHPVPMTPVVDAHFLYTGEVIQYWHGKQTILHQIVFIGEDNKGWFCLTKGTNHFWLDLWSVRASDIISRLIAIIYG